MRFRLVLFDLDGTLFESEDEAWRAVSAAAKAIPELSCIRTKTQMLRLFHGNFYEETCKVAKLPKSKIHWLEKRMRRTFIKDYHPHIVPGIRQVVGDIAGHTEGMTIAVMSSNFNNTIKRLLRSGKMQSFVDVVSGADNEPSKVKRIRALLKKKRVKPSETICVTDTVGDVRECRKAGVKCIGVSWGFHSPTMLRRAGAIAIARTPSHLRRLLYA